VGPESIGKFTTAFAFAGVLLCERRKEELGGEDACGECAACKKMKASVHPDFMVIRRDGQFIKIGEFESERKQKDPPQIRQLIAAANRKPYEGPVNVFVVDEAHRMTTSAANSLLKTLEEPPGNTVVVLTATMSGSLPHTIVSRCRVVRFQALQQQKLEKEIQRTRGLDKDVAQLLAAFSAGRMDLALTNDPEKIAARLERAIALLGAGIRGRTDEILKVVAGVGRPSEEAETLLESFRLILREAILLQRDVSGKHLMSEGISEKLRPLIQSCPLRVLEKVFQQVGLLLQDIRLRNVNPQLGWESLLFGFRSIALTGGINR
jgi:DNA polymerase-3 subunit delta'